MRALALAANISYDTAYDILAERGRKCSRGFHFPFGSSKIKSGDLPEAGIRLTWVSFPAVPGETRMNLAKFSAKFRTGVYIARTAKHVQVAIDGVFYDTSKQYDQRCIYGAWKITPIPQDQ